MGRAAVGASELGLLAAAMVGVLVRAGFVVTYVVGLPSGTRGAFTHHVGRLLARSSGGRVELSVAGYW